MKRLSFRSVRENFPVLLLMVLPFALSACDSNVLSERFARCAIEKEAMFRDSSQVAVLDVGYYEVKPEMRAVLDSLVKLGVVNCKIDEVKERRRFEKYTWWEGTKVYYKEVNHYFADVSLTDAGKKFLVCNPPTTRLGDEPAISGDVPVAGDSLLLASYDDTAADSIGAVEVAKDADSAEKEEDKNLYSAALARVKYTSEWVLTGFYKVKKVYDVFCPPSYAREGRGTCHFVCSFEGVTPFGSVMESRREGERIKGRATLLHYLDNGWKVEYLSFDEL